jgi:predicted membrane protein
MEKRVVKIILIVLIIIVAVLAVYFTFFYSRNCKTAECFNFALTKCYRASYINDAEDAAWYYKIKGKSGDNCKIYVKLLQLKQGTGQISSLEGKEMTCYTQLGMITSPQGNLANCHGLLKEEMQNLIINRLHNYIVSNLGQISEELTKVI